MYSSPDRCSERLASGQKSSKNETPQRSENKKVRNSLPTINEKQLTEADFPPLGLPSTSQAPLSAAQLNKDNAQQPTHPSPTSKAQPSLAQQVKDQKKAQKSTESSKKSSLQPRT